MPSVRVYRDINHDLFGGGYRIWDQRGFFVDHYYRGRVRVVDFVSKADGLSWLTIFIPHREEGPGSKDHWEESMQTDWLSKAAAARNAATQGGKAVTDEKFAAKFPAVTAFMTCTEQNGVPRETSKLQLFTDDGTWKVAFHDPNTEHSLFLTLQSPTEAFQAVEKALTAERPDWRAWSKKTGKKR